VREDARAKAGRYLAEGRLVLHEHGGTVSADCRCAHLLALGLVVALKPRKAGP